LTRRALEEHPRTVLGEPAADWRAKRRETALADIVDTAWELAREHGLAGLSLRDLARKLGMAAPSLYSYFDSKHALYDAMFADGYRALLAMDPPEQGDDVRTTLHNTMGFYLWFALADPVRYQLLSQRTIPGFEPSAAAYALAQEAYDWSVAPLREVAEVTQDDLDLISAVVGGLISQQISNDPGGTRWVRLLDDTVDLLVPRLEQRKKRPASARDRSTGKKEKS
jgi:AcrR family transcriptional regulator